MEVIGLQRSQNQIFEVVSSGSDSSFGTGWQGVGLKDWLANAMLQRSESLETVCLAHHFRQIIFNCVDGLRLQECIKDTTCDENQKKKGLIKELIDVAERSCQASFAPVTRA
jgi:hypothetical protein